jgi:hypothetical protein
LILWFRLASYLWLVGEINIELGDQIIGIVQVDVRLPGVVRLRPANPLDKIVTLALLDLGVDDGLGFVLETILA